MPVPPRKVRRNAEIAKEERELWRGVKNMPTTRVGVRRMNQLIRGDDLSMDTIKRMNSFFSRHQHNNISGDRDSKGRLSKATISWLAWGGDEGWDWAQKQLRKIGML